MRNTIILALLIISLTTPVSFAQNIPARAQTAQTAADRGWPRAYSLPSEAQLVIYQPQISSWQDQKQLVAYTAVSYVAKGEQKPALGTIKLETETETSVPDRLVKFSKIKISETNFPTLSKEQTQEIVSEIEKNMPERDRVIDLDRVLAFVDKSTINPKNVEGLKSDPPRIILTQSPSILVNFDGEPIWSPIKDNELKYAVNTNWDIFQHTATGMYYLRNDTTWLRATDLQGYWSNAGKLPDSFNKLPEDDNWKDVRASLPGTPAKKLPKVYVTNDPSELILIDGEPKYEPVPNTGLLWISNTESDLFRLGRMVRFTTWSRAAGLRLRVWAVTGPSPHRICRKTSSEFPLNIRARAFSRQCREHSKRQKLSCSLRSRNSLV